MILDGKAVAKKIETKIKEKAKEFSDEFGMKASLHTVLVGNDEASRIYAKSKLKTLKNLGMEGEIHFMDEDSREEEVIALLKNLSSRKDVHGLMVEMPLPKHIRKELILPHIDPNKDVDCQNPTNLGYLLLGFEERAPSTPRAVIRILEEYGVGIASKSVCIINRTPVVGKPLALLFLNRDATVIICHSKTKNIPEITKRSDIIVVAVGKPNFLKEDMVSSESVVIDVGINSVDGKIVGDADFNSLVNKVSMITPVPGGVGSVTTMLIIEQALRNAYIQMGKVY
ncbi:MAG: bifunctional 5,10-methylenetetrahydrofolate dehydrogenase/5,10-methenyltetrahydrofolate cyclohydrolase [Thermoplasmata archaeon]|nr:bifunctional 5,10-methylenetetrahydrofolate dehydrogenase/5,10-methenyltetrahydrofolate cyclohydrolase [Thermoplasmatales archaeon]